MGSMSLQVAGPVHEGQGNAAAAAVAAVAGPVLEWEGPAAWAALARGDDLPAGMAADIAIEEVVGLQGPLRPMVENAIMVVVFNALVLAAALTGPFTVGRVAAGGLVQLSEMFGLESRAVTWLQVHHRHSFLVPSAFLRDETKMWFVFPGRLSILFRAPSPECLGVGSQLGQPNLGRRSILFCFPSHECRAVGSELPVNIKHVLKTCRNFQHAAREDNWWQQPAPEGLKPHDNPNMRINIFLQV